MFLRSNMASGAWCESRFTLGKLVCTLRGQVTPRTVSQPGVRCHRCRSYRVAPSPREAFLRRRCALYGRLRIFDSIEYKPTVSVTLRNLRGCVLPIAECISDACDKKDRRVVLNWLYPCSESFLSYYYIDKIQRVDYFSNREFCAIQF